MDYTITKLKKKLRTIVNNNNKNKKNNYIIPYKQNENGILFLLSNTWLQPL